MNNVEYIREKVNEKLSSAEYDGIEFEIINVF